MKLLIIQLLLLSCLNTFGQEFTQQDSLRGSITPEREWWDLTYYHLDIEVLPESKEIKGSNIVQYKVLKEHNVDNEFSKY